MHHAQSSKESPNMCDVCMSMQDHEIESSYISRVCVCENARSTKNNLMHVATSNGIKFLYPWNICVIIMYGMDTFGLSTYLHIINAMSNLMFWHCDAYMIHVCGRF